MKDVENKPVLMIITEKYDEIFQAEKKVADMILKRPGDVINLNVSELAARSGVSDATVVRLCKHLGYKGYYQMKICLFRDMQYSDMNVDKQKTEQDSSFQARIEQMGENVKKVGELNSEQTFMDCVKVIKDSAGVYLCALGNTANLAKYAEFRMERMGLRCSFDPQPEYFMNHINLATEKDCLIAISESGTSRSVVTAMELAREKGMGVIAVSAYKYSPVSQLADKLLLTPATRSVKGNVQHSRLEEMAVLDLLFQLLENELSIDENVSENPEMLLAEIKY